MSGKEGLTHPEISVKPGQVIFVFLGGVATQTELQKLNCPKTGKDSSQEESDRNNKWHIKIAFFTCRPLRIGMGVVSRHILDYNLRLLTVASGLAAQATNRGEPSPNQMLDWGGGTQPSPRRIMGDN